jgi:hypothetical protein
MSGGCRIPLWLPQRLSSTGIRPSDYRKQWMCPEDKVCIMSLLFETQSVRECYWNSDTVRVSTGIKWKVTYCLESGILWVPLLRQKILKTEVNWSCDSIPEYEWIIIIISYSLCIKLIRYFVRIIIIISYSLCFNLIRYFIWIIFIISYSLCINLIRYFVWIFISREVGVLKETSWGQYLVLRRNK